MNDKHPEALRLADEFEATKSYMGAKAAAELRRLHEVNAELVEALRTALDVPFDDDPTWFNWRDQAFAAIAKATGEQQ